VNRDLENKSKTKTKNHLSSKHKRRKEGLHQNELKKVGGDEENFPSQFGRWCPINKSRNDGIETEIEWMNEKTFSRVEETRPVFFQHNIQQTTDKSIQQTMIWKTSRNRNTTRSL